MSRLSKKDYEFFAKQFFLFSKNYNFEYLIERVAGYFQEDNPQFSRERFYSWVYPNTEQRKKFERVRE